MIFHLKRGRNLQAKKILQSTVVLALILLMNVVLGEEANHPVVQAFNLATACEPNQF
jgi:hypothetical protein